MRVFFSGRGEFSVLKMVRLYLKKYFSNSLIIHQVKTKNITTVKEV